MLDRQISYNDISINQGCKNALRKTMYSLSANTKRWRISKEGKTLLSGIGTATQAIALAKSHGIVLTHFYNLPNFKRVA